MGNKSDVDQLCQSNRSSGVTRGDALLQTAHQNGAGVGEVIFPLLQFLECSNSRIWIRLFSGLPGAPCVQQSSPTVKPGFCCGKELVHTIALCNCCSAHHLPPIVVGCGALCSQIQLSYFAVV